MMMSGRATNAKKSIPSSPQPLSRGSAGNKAMKVMVTTDTGNGPTTKRVIITRSSTNLPAASKGQEEEMISDEPINVMHAEAIETEEVIEEDTEIPPSLMAEVDDAFDDGGKMPHGDEPRTQDLEEFNGWPLYWDKPIDYSEACDIILGAKRVEETKICNEVPQDFRGEGTFVINLENFRNRHDVNGDGLGSWGKPCGRCRFYKYNDKGEAVRQDSTGKLDPGMRYDVKVICKRYEHPSVKGQFFKKIYTGICPLPRGPLPLAVVTYMWRGEPVDFTINKAATPARTPAHVPVHAKQWEVDELRDSADLTEYDGCPLYANIAIEFSEAARLILGAKSIEHSRVCAKVPQSFRGTGTFVVDLRSFGPSVDLRRDANGVWGKPAGHSRYYQIDPTTGDAIRVDRANKAPGTDYDIQILSKRYEHPKTGSKFVRKIFTGRPQNAKPMESCCNLAILCYYWKGEPFDFEAEKYQSGHNRPRMKAPLFRAGSSIDIDPETSDYGVPMDMESEDLLLDEDDGSEPKDNPGPSRQSYGPIGGGGRKIPVTSSAMRKRVAGNTYGIRTMVEQSDAHLTGLKRLILDREYENQERMSQLLDRAEGFLDRLETSALGQLAWAGPAEQIVPADQIVVDENVVVQQNGQEYVTVPTSYHHAVNIM